MVAQLGARKAVAQKQIGKWPQPEHTEAPCQPASGSACRCASLSDPRRASPSRFDVVGTTSIVEEGDNDDS